MKFEWHDGNLYIAHPKLPSVYICIPGIPQEIKLKVGGHITLRDARTKELLAQTNNIMVTTGLTVLAGGLCNELYLGWAAIGTSDTAPAVSDTKLGTEYHREQITLSSYIANIVTAQTFFLEANCTVHIKEVGIFGSDGTSAADSGSLFAHALLDYDNTGSPKDLILSWAITLSIGS